MPLQGFDQAIFPKVLSSLVERFGNPIGVEYQRVSGKELALRYRAFPFFEEPQHRASGIELFNGAVAPEEQCREMSTVRIAQPPHLVVVFGKEERGVGAVAGILKKKLIHRVQQPLR